MNHDVSPPAPDLSPEDVALESELRLRLQPCPLRAGLRQEILEPLGSVTSAVLEEEDVFAEDLRRRLQPGQVPSQMWAQIAPRLEGLADKPHSTRPEEDKIAAFPQWREFTPLFKAAAVVAIGVFVASVWWNPDLRHHGKTADRPGLEDSVNRASSSVRVQDPANVIPIGRRGFIQRMESQGLMEMDNQVYERYWQTRKDRSMYRVDGNLRVEDEVSREGPVITRLRTF